MRIGIIGGGPIADPLARLAERAGHAVCCTVDGAGQPAVTDATDLLILTGSRAAVEPIVANVREAMPNGVIVIDAMIPTQDERGASAAVAPASREEWIKTRLPRARFVRAFASVPADALTALLHDPTSEKPPSLAVPLVGDDPEAKTLVGEFMREIGVEPFDLGAPANADVLDPGGALWGKALSPLEMFETVGWLSGDG